MTQGADLVIIEGVVFEQVADHDRVRDDDEGLGSKGELVNPPALDEPLVKRLEERLVAGKVGELALTDGDVFAADVGLMQRERGEDVGGFYRRSPAIKM